LPRIAALVLVTVLGVVVAWPLLSGTEAQALGGRTVDGIGSWWVQWWVGEALAGRGSLFESPLMFHPWGKDLLGDTGGNLVDAVIAAILGRWLGPVLAWNLLCVGIVLSNALAAGTWLRSHGPWAALAGATAAGLHPYPLFELAQGRPTQALLAPAILALALGARAVSAEGTSKQALGAGVLLALTGWTYWFAAGFVALALTLLTVGASPTKRIGRLGLIGLVSFALSTPAVIPLMGGLLGDTAVGSVGGALPTSTWLGLLDGSTSELNLVTRAGDRGALGVMGLWGEVSVRSSTTATLEGLALSGTALLLALAAFWQRRRWLVVALAALLLAVGPLPGGVPNPIYIGLAAILPPMERLYWPCRALALFVPLAAVGGASLVGRLPRYQPVGVVLIAAALLSEAGLRGAWPLPTWDTAVPKAYHCLAATEGAVVVIPYGRDHDQLLHQTLHGLPMLGGMNERSRSLVPPEQRALRAENAWLAQLLRATANPRDSGTWTDAERDAVAELGYRWVVLRPQALNLSNDPDGGQTRRRIMSRRLRELAGAPVYQDADVVIYAPWGDELVCPPPGWTEVVGSLDKR